jgi:hypothetical protein
VTSGSEKSTMPTRARLSSYFLPQQSQQQQSLQQQGSCLQQQHTGGITGFMTSPSRQDICRRYLVSSNSRASHQRLDHLGNSNERRRPRDLIGGVSAARRGFFGDANVQDAATTPAVILAVECAFCLAELAV